MAKTLSTIFSVDMSTIVNNAITFVKAIRTSEQARKEAEFQKAIAGGMSYKDQIKFREKQLEEEKKSNFSDESYIETLDVSIANTKKLARFETIRNKYTQSLNDYVTGKGSIAQHIEVLQGILGGEQDPEKQKEIQGLLSSALKEQSDIEINAIKNRALLAQKDNSTQLLDNSISEVQSKRALASINKNDDEVSAWDSTLLALRSSKSKLLIENGLNEITYQTNRSNLKSGEKLGLYNNYVSGADASNPVVYEGITYPSLKAYWENKRGEYITTNYFGEVKKEIDAKNSEIASTNSYGQVPVARIQAINDFYTTLKNRDEFKQYADRIEQGRIDVVTGMANNLYTSLVDEANSQDTPNAYARAETAITSVENRLGIKIARPAFETEVAEGKTIAQETTKKPVKEEAPVQPTPKPKPAAAPVSPQPITSPAPQTEMTPTTPRFTTVKAGETLSAIAQRELGDALRWKELKAADGTAYDEETAKTLQIGTKLIIPQ